MAATTQGPARVVRATCMEHGAEGWWTGAGFTHDPADARRTTSDRWLAAMLRFAERHAASSFWTGVAVRDANALPTDPFEIPHGTKCSSCGVTWNTVGKDELCRVCRPGADAGDCGWCGGTVEDADEKYCSPGCRSNARAAGLDAKTDWQLRCDEDARAVRA